jgi:hypothetical protein
LRETCRAILEVLPWHPKTHPPREVLCSWKHEASAALVNSRMEEVLFSQLRLCRHLDKGSLARAAAFVARRLDLCLPQGQGGSRHRVNLISPSNYSGWTEAFDAGGSFLLAQDGFDGAVRSDLRYAAESLSCVGIAAEVLGPFKYPRRRNACISMEEHPSFVFLGGCHWLGRGEIWALRVAKPLTGW